MTGPTPLPRADPLPPRGSEEPLERVERRLRRALGQAIQDYGMLEEGDRVMVALSGGKDSYTLLVLLDELQRRAPIRFELIPVHLDQAQPGYDGRGLAAWLEARGGEHHVLREDTYSVVTEKIPADKTYCSLCSRLRRGILYTTATRLGCTKIALGHHRDDAIETLLLNQFFSGQLKTMPPRLTSDDGAHVVIRPLYLCAEADIVRFAEAQRFPIIPCNLCGSQEGLWREQVRDLLRELEPRIPNLRATLLASLRNVRPSHLADAGLWTQLGLGPQASSGERP
ncbi:MAG: tRNA 2-thiocytidine(32) synthetase TtcA [Planctomycetes bacterium]|nr:tRNA 2-thiocytidine(32) synthetase TtcA [Planctomycetota bacterium]